MTKFYLFSRYLTVLLFFITTMAWSQSRTVTGTVTASDDGSGLPGVNILEKGTSNGTITAPDGSYTIQVGDNATLVFSFVGYRATEVVVGTQTSVNVSLEADVTSLSEVVVIGYGEVNKRDATGAVTSVTSKDFNPGVISSPEQLIQGRTAGVQMTSTTGNPGDAVQLRIRGTNSIRSNNNPLFVVDGVPLSGGTQPATADLGLGSSGDTNPLNFLNPSDIESISILKDASATAIYGSRGANGVVIITTKKGKGKGGLEFTSNFSLSTPAKKYDLLNREEFLDAVDQFGGDRVAQDKGANTDWQDYILRNSFSHKQNLAYSRAFGSTTLRASAGYEDQQGIIENSFMKRLTGKINLGHAMLDDKLNIDLSTTFSNTRREDPPISGNAGFQGDLLGAAYSANPTWPTDPTFNPGGQRSPANMLETFSSTGKTNRLLANLSADYKLTNNLSAKATYGIDMSNADRVTLVNGEAFNVGDNVTGFGAGQVNHNKNLNHLLELTATYNKRVGSTDINFVGGYSVQSFRNQWDWGMARGFANFSDFDAMEDELRDNFDVGDGIASNTFSDYNNWGFSDNLNGGFVNGINFGEGTLVQQLINSRPAGITLDGIAANYYDQTDYLQSYFGRANVTINEKYLITATLRADGSSKFGDDFKYGLFPSAALAWQLHEEEFLPETFSTLKLRAGYGVVGNQDGLGYGDSRRRERWADVGAPNNNRQINIPGSSTQGSTNTQLKWESTSQLSVGVDFGFINDRLSGSFDYYNKQTSDLLLRYRPAQPTLEAIIFGNLDAVVENKGWEFSLAYVAIDSDDAGLTISGNISQNKNLVKDLGGIQFEAGQIYGQGLSGAYAQLLATDRPLFSYHLRQFEGFDENGQPIGDIQGFVDKSALPEWNMGLSINGRVKNFDLVMNMAGQFGFYVYNNTKNAFFTAGSINNARNVTRDVLTSGEAGAAEAAVSTRFLEKGDFFRMQNINLGYRFPMSGNGAIKNLRLSIGAQNVFLITNYSGLDPEVSTNPASFSLLNGLPTAGIDYAAYPRPRTYTLGLSATF